MNHNNFKVVLLGSDINVYGLARSFWNEYKIESHIVCKYELSATKHSRIIASITPERELFRDEVFLRTLLAVHGKIQTENSGEKILLIPASDTYAELISRNQYKLKDYFTFFTNPYALFQQLGDRESFYKLCEKYNISYPRTYQISKEKHNYRYLPNGFVLPLILKPGDPVEYYQTSFKGKKKVYLVNSETEYNAATKRIYTSSYSADFIVQEYIGGDQSLEAEVHAYSNSDGKVVFMQFNRVLLEEVSSGGIGSYVAVITGSNQELYDKIKSFLEDIKYTGFSNFDLKFNKTDAQWKFFEINQRPSRSSFTIDCAGYSIAKLIVDDLIHQKPFDGTTLSTKSVLYSLIPKRLVLKYSNPSLKNEINSFYKANNVHGSFLDKSDINPKRFLMHVRMQLSYVKQFKRLFGKSMSVDE